MLKEHRERLLNAPSSTLATCEQRWLWDALSTETVRAISAWPAAFERLQHRTGFDEASVMGNPDGLSFDKAEGDLRSDGLGDDGGSVLGLMFLSDASVVDPAARTRSLSLTSNGIGDFGASQIFRSC
jgi:hypothetical protein